MKIPTLTPTLLLLGWATLLLPARAADGLIGRYYSGYSVVSNRIAFDGLTLVSTRTNTVFDFWNGGRYEDWNPIGNGFYSVRWTGFLHITNAGLYGFGTISDDGSEVWINGARVVDNHKEQWFDWQEGWVELGAGYHTLEITFFEHDSFSGIEVWWLKPESAPSVLPYSGETFHTIPPTFNSDTKWEILRAPAVQTGAPYLTVFLTADNTVVVSWPGPAEGWVLQATSDLTGSGAWSDLAPPYQTNGTNLQFIEPVPVGQRFFRLYRP